MEWRRGQHGRHEPVSSWAFPLWMPPWEVGTPVTRLTGSDRAQAALEAVRAQAVPAWFVWSRAPWRQALVGVTTLTVVLPRTHRLRRILGCVPWSNWVVRPSNSSVPLSRQPCIAPARRRSIPGLVQSPPPSPGFRRAVGRDVPAYGVDGWLIDSTHVGRVRIRRGESPSGSESPSPSVPSALSVASSMSN